MRIGLVVALIVFAGCATPAPAPDDNDEPWHEAALLFPPEHDHANPSHHEGLTTKNFEVVGFTPFTSDHYAGQVGGGYLCGDARPVDDGRQLAAVESRSDVAFALLDVTDTASPVVLGEFVLATTYIYDLAISPSGKHVILATAGPDQNGLPISAPVAPDEAPVLTWKSACGAELPVPGEPLIYPMNGVLVNVEDPSSPFIEDVVPLAGLGHSVLPIRHDSEDLVLITTATGVVANNPASAYNMYRINPAVAGVQGTSTLELLSIYQAPPEELALQAGHDGWLQVHPITGQLLGYLAGETNLWVVDYSNPRAPQQIANWQDPVNRGTGFATSHSAFTIEELWDGKHYTVVAPEHFGPPDEYPTGVAWVLDTTDPTNPVQVAAWTLPHSPEWSGTYMFSLHYFSVVGKTLFISTYHGGVWAIDLSPVGTSPMVELQASGVFVPANADLPPPAHWVRWAPTVEEAIGLPDGTIVTFDGNYGLYAVRYNEATDVPPAPPYGVLERLG